MSTNIRSARLGEQNLLTSIALSAKRHWNYPERWIEIWKPLLAITPEYLAEADVWISVKENEIAGFCALIYTGGRAALEHFWISPSFMGQGIGRGLFKHALERSRARGCTVLRIESDPNAQGFYERMGGRQVGERVGEVDAQPRVLPIMEIEM
jgi:ribosomal protein S18 acetylase RimI-like enzyme